MTKIFLCLSSSLLRCEQEQVCHRTQKVDRLCNNIRTRTQTNTRIRMTCFNILIIN